MGEEAIKIGGNKWIKRKKVKEENGEEEKKAEEVETKKKQKIPMIFPNAKKPPNGWLLH